MKDVERLCEIRKVLGLSRYQVAKRTGLSVRDVKDFEYGNRTPSDEKYNALAEVLGIERKKIPKTKKAKGKKKPVPTVKTKKTLKLQKVKNTDNDESLLSIEIPKPPVFEAGHMYKIYSPTSGRDEDYIFRYERKDGIHHCFIEIHGSWSRTYTDYQLIGKNVKEVE